MMLDWVTAKIPFMASGRLCDGHVMSFDRNGELKYSIDQRMPVVGSHDEKIHIRTVDVDFSGNTCLIEFSGNPIKFLQGHNVWGSSDLLAVVLEAMHAVSKVLCRIQPRNIVEQWERGDYQLSRVDLNEMYHFRDRAEVLAWLYGAGQTSRTRSQGAISKGSTVYWNKTSKRWSVKAYSKGQELALLRNKSCLLPKSLIDFADAALRIELTLKSRELDELGLKCAANWRTIEELDLYTDYIGRIQMTEQKTTGEIFFQVKNRAVAATYQMWLDGHDLRQILPHNTFYRHRRELLKHEVDIAVACVRGEVKPSNVVPLKRVIEMKPVTIPDWAYGTDLYFEPRKLS
jgi:II/X family phage/plasmid replication protein